MFPLFSPFQWQQKVSIPRTAMAFVPWCRVDFRFRCGHLGSGNTTISERLNPPTSFTPNIIQYLQYIDWLMVEPYPSEKYESQIGSSSQLVGKITNVPNHQRVDQCNDHPNISTYQLCCQVKIVDGFQLGQYYLDPRFNPKLAIIMCSFLFILSMPYSTPRNDRTTIHHFSEKSTCLSFLKACHLNVFIFSISPLPPGARLAKTPAEALRSCRRCV
jgi:hypothetical protein